MENIQYNNLIRFLTLEFSKLSNDQLEIKNIIGNLNDELLNLKKDLEIIYEQISSGKFYNTDIVRKLDSIHSDLERIEAIYLKK
jgi:hypothetical protein